MKITILGCGNAFSTVNGNNCILLEEEGIEPGKSSRLLIDAGWDLPHMLKRNNIGIDTITDVYISHLHADHIGGLEYLGFSRYDWLSKPKSAPPTSPRLYANERLMEEIWQKSLRGGMESIEGVDCTLGTFFRLRPIGPNEPFTWMGWTVRLVQQVHIMTGSIISNTFGLILSQEGHKTLYLVTDSQHCSPRQLEVFYKQADIIIQDCELIGVDTKEKKMKFCSNVHANYGQLAGWAGSNSTILPNSIKSKMFLTHYQDFYNQKKDFFGNDCDWNELANSDSFAGFVYPGMQFVI